MSRQLSRAFCLVRFAREIDFLLTFPAAEALPVCCTDYRPAVHMRTMAGSSAITACALTIACWLCQPCSGFVSSSFSHAAGASRQRVQPVVSVQQPTRTLWNGNLSRLARNRRSRGSVGGASILAAPSELWDSYLSALEAAPLLTKVNGRGFYHTTM